MKKTPNPSMKSNNQNESSKEEDKESEWILNFKKKWQENKSAIIIIGLLLMLLKCLHAGSIHFSIFTINT